MAKDTESIEFGSNIKEIWGLLDDNERELVKNSASLHNFKKNQIIYYEGGKAENLMCLLKGKVKIYKEGIGGRNQIIRMIKPVEYFGYRAYFANEKYLTTASTVESSVVYGIPMSIVLKIIRNNFDLSYFFIRQLSVDLGISDERIVSLTQKHIRGRLAESLIFLMESYGLDEDFSINIYLSREDLANLSNMTTSNAIRTLSDFVQERIITLDGRKIKVIDEEKLRNISRLG